MEIQSTQILSLEAALLARPQLPPDAPESEKDKLLAEQAKTIRELEIVVKGYEDNLGEPLRAVREDVEREWIEKLEKEIKRREEKEAWSDELVKQLDKEKKVILGHSFNDVMTLTHVLADAHKARGGTSGSGSLRQEIRLPRAG